MEKSQSLNFNFLIVLVCLCVDRSMGDCPYKECSCAPTEIFCQNLKLTSFPTLISIVNSGDFTNLILDENQITTVPAQSLPSNLTEISFSNNPITTIDENAFQDSKFTLQSITFKGARFTRIPDAFLQLRTLEYFNMYNTPILDWNINVMKNIGQTIRTLDFQNVGLSSWPVWFQYFSNLMEVNIDDSSIPFIPDNAFDSLINTLIGLSISNGSLTSLPKSMSNLLALESLDLSYNKITNITFISKLSKLSSLSVKFNKITDPNHLSTELRPFAESLLSLEVENNQLTAIPDLSFLSKIESLDFKHNSIFDPSAGAVPPGLYEIDLGYNFLPSIPSLWLKLQSVTSLMLSYNSVTHIHGADFHSSTFGVSLGYNLIIELSDDSFPQNSSIRTIYLNNNPLSRISANAFKNLHLLMKLDLQGTMISRLPLQLSSLNSLKSLDMSNSIYLICTCIEKALETWILHLEEVKGNCGLISIYNFYATLSQDCPDI